MLAEQHQVHLHLQVLGTGRILEKIGREGDAAHRVVRAVENPDIGQIRDPLADQPKADVEGKDRAVLAHHEHIQGVDLSGRLLDQVAVPQGEGVAIDHHGAVVARTDQRPVLFQVAAEAVAVFQQHGLMVMNQGDEIEGLKRQGVFRRGENEKGVFSRHEAEPDQFGDQFPQHPASLVLGGDGEHLQNVALPGPYRYQLPGLKDTDQAFEVFFKSQTAPLDQGLGLLDIPFADELYNHEANVPCLKCIPMAYEQKFERREKFLSGTARICLCWSYHLVILPFQSVARKGFWGGSMA